MNFENHVVHITTQQKNDDLNHPLNNFNNSKSSGTGFYIGHGIILTCYHVIENSLKISVKTYNINYEIFDNNATIKYAFPDDDLAVIEVDNKDIIYNIFDYYILTNKINNLEVNTVGYPLNSTTLKINKGVISGYQDSNIQTDSTLNAGNSGGPLLYNNKVIGINQSKMTGDASNTGFAVPIFRFLILYKLKNNELKLLNNKPTLLFRFQKNKQKFYNFDYGVRLSKLHSKSCLHKYNIKVDDIILKINGNKIDNEGKIKFSFFPEKISLDEIKYWFTNGDKISITYYSSKEEKILETNIELEYFETNLLNYYKEIDRKYVFENNGLVFSIFTNKHIEEIDNLEISLTKKVKLLSRFLSIEHQFTIYLSDLVYSKLNFTEYPINDIITHINDVEIDCYDTMASVMKNSVYKIKTIDNNIFFIKK